MSLKEIAGTLVALDDQGYLLDYSQWTIGIAKEIAREEGIEELTDRHFTVIYFMRQEFEKNGTGPSIRRLVKTGGVPTKKLYELFPGGPAKKAARIAGITKPDGCI